MVQFIPSRNTAAEIGERFAQGAVKGYQTRADEKALQKVISDIPKDATPRQILDAITNVSTYSPEAKQNMLSNYIGGAKMEEEIRQAKATEDYRRAMTDLEKRKTDIAEKTQAKELDLRSRQLDIEEGKIASKKSQEQLLDEKADAIIDQLDLPPERKDALKGKIDYKQAVNLLKEQMKPSKDSDLSISQKIIQKKSAENYIKMVEELPQFIHAADNIDKVEKLADDLGAFGINWLGPLSGYLGTESAKELEALSFTGLQGVVKIFNPSGPIAQKKLEQLAKLYQIKATDNPYAIRGKIKALRTLNQQTLERTKQKMALYREMEKTGKPINEEDMMKLEEDDVKLIDAMTDMLEDEIKMAEGTPLEKEESTKLGLTPELAKKRGSKSKPIMGPDGKEYYTDGEKWYRK